MGFNESVNTFNNLIRTILAAIVVAGIGTASYIGYSAYTAGERQEQDLADAKQLGIIIILPDWHCHEEFAPSRES